jgi:hypothetical protein
MSADIWRAAVLTLSVSVAPLTGQREATTQAQGGGGCEWVQCYDFFVGFACVVGPQYSNEYGLCTATVWECRINRCYWASVTGPTGRPVALWSPCSPEVLVVDGGAPDPSLSAEMPNALGGSEMPALSATPAGPDAFAGSAVP